MLAGYAGKTGWIDLSMGRAWDEALDGSLARKCLGGKGLGPKSDDCREPRSHR
jgi:aldehyde:ferredoxin oxidoreductase